MQATVSGFDVATRSGRVLTDDGAELAFSSDAFDASGLRLLRPGQRVRVSVAGTPSVVETLQILTLP
jgi:cold shock CspA family protein